MVLHREEHTDGRLIIFLNNAEKYGNNVENALQPDRSSGKCRDGCLFFVASEIVSQAPFGLDILRIRGIVLDFFTKTAYMHIDRAHISGGLEFLAPDQLQEHDTAVDLAGVCGQHCRGVWPAAQAFQIPCW